MGVNDMKRVFVSIEPCSAEELAGQIGWEVADDGLSVHDGRGNAIRVWPEADGRLAIEVGEDVDFEQALQRVPFEAA